MELFNSTPHAAHEKRADAALSLPTILVWQQGRRLLPGELRQVFRHVQFERTVQPNGYVRIQRFSLYAERGLARQRVSIWLHDGRLQIAYREALLAHYTATYSQNNRQLRTIAQPVLYTTTYRSPQLECWDLDEDQWRKILEHPIAHRRTRAGVPSME